MVMRGEYARVWSPAASPVTFYSSRLFIRSRDRLPLARTLAARVSFPARHVERDIKAMRLVTAHRIATIWRLRDDGPAREVMAILDEQIIEGCVMRPPFVGVVSAAPQGAES